MQHSLKYLIGIIVGTTIVLVAGATGIRAALVALPVIGSVLGTSAAYILWLAYHIATAPPLAEQTVAIDAPSLAGRSLLGVAERRGRPSVSSQPGRIAIFVESSDSTGQSYVEPVFTGFCGANSPGLDPMNVTRLARPTLAPRRGR